MSLLFVCYGENGTDPVILEQQPHNVIFEGGGTSQWWYRRSTQGGRAGPFKVGSGVRVPEGQESFELYGPMMVLEKGNPDHQSNYERAFAEIFHRPTAHA